MRLVFNTGTMGSKKTANLLLTKFAYEETNSIVKTALPECDERYGQGIIKSRAGLEAYADFLLKDYDDIKDHFLINRDFEGQNVVLLIDEIQFLKRSTIDSLRALVDEDDVLVLGYGLRTDFRKNLFEGSKRMMELADEVLVLPSFCAYCANAATFNLRIDTFNTEQILLGGDELYKAVCSECYAAEMEL